VTQWKTYLAVGTGVERVISRLVDTAVWAYKRELELASHQYGNKVNK
jgi:hypothetical protein